MPAPDGPQFTRVYHSSDTPFPVHEIENPRLDKRVRLNPYGNAHPDVIHTGTEQAASTGPLSKRVFMHAYDVPSEHIYPVTFGDEEHIMNEREDSYRKRMFKHSIVKNNIQEGLFETVPGDPLFAVKTNMAIPYRNMAEDHGSLSYMLPKKAINEGKIIYRGVKNTRFPDGGEDADL